MDIELQGAGVNGDSSTATIDSSFPHLWEAEILSARPLILPSRSFVYPAQAEEVERGALEVLIRPRTGESAFLATCALGFKDPAVPTGLWACPAAEEICAVSGGYAYVIDTTAPERFTMIGFRPVLEVRAAVEAWLLLFVGHHGILAWGADGLVWRSEKLSDEGVTITAVEGGVVRGVGWNMMTDKDAPFAVDLDTGLNKKTA